MLFLLYDLIVWTVLLVLVPYYLLLRIIGGKRRRRLLQRLGFFSSSDPAPPPGEKVIWVHAVSVGETIAARPLLRELRRRFPGHSIALSTVTETGREISEKTPEIDYRLFFPFDTRFAARRALRRVNASLVIVVETEIWPGFLSAASSLGIPVALANGRISDRSFPRYRRFASLLRPVLENFSLLCMQTETDAQRVAAMGAPAARVRVARNLKYDLPVSIASTEERRSLRQEYRLPDDIPLFVAASTHAGEEERGAEAFRSAASRTPAAMVLVPRHPERAAAVREALERQGFRVVLRSTLQQETPLLKAGEVLLVDTVGEMMKLYRACDVAFVGGSLVPVGGHNVLEPASCGLPVIYGPHMHNFREIAALLEGAGGGFPVADHGALAPLLEMFLADRDERKAAGERAADFQRSTGGAAEMHVDLLAPLLER